MSRLAPRRLAGALGELEGLLEPASVLARVQRVWGQAAGPALAGAGRPVSEREGLLTIVCSDSVWAHELELMGPELVERLNEALGEPLLQRIRSRTG